MLIPNMTNYGTMFAMETIQRSQNSSHIDIWGLIK